MTVPPFALWVEGDNTSNDEDDDDDDDDDEEEGKLSDQKDDTPLRRKSLSSSVDSRTYGPLCKNNLIGVAEQIFWPPSRWGSIPCEKDASRRSWWM